MFAGKVKWLVMALALAGAPDRGQATENADWQVAQYCAVQFDARAKWHAVMSGSAEGFAQMAQRRDALLRRGPKDGQRAKAQLKSGRLLPSFDHRSLTLLTQFVENGGPVDCALDALCTACTEVGASYD